MAISGEPIIAHHMCGCLLPDAPLDRSGQWGNDSHKYKMPSSCWKVEPGMMPLLIIFRGVEQDIWSSDGKGESNTFLAGSYCVDRVGWSPPPTPSVSPRTLQVFLDQPKKSISTARKSCEMFVAPPSREQYKKVARPFLAARAATVKSTNAVIIIIIFHHHLGQQVTVYSVIAVADTLFVEGVSPQQIRCNDDIPNSFSPRVKPWCSTSHAKARYACALHYFLTAYSTIPYGPYTTTPPSKSPFCQESMVGKAMTMTCCKSILLGTARSARCPPAFFWQRIPVQYMFNPLEIGLSMRPPQWEP
jgi:hypothetical protein